MTSASSEETAVVARYLRRHDAEIARSYLQDNGIDAVVVADDVHVSLQSRKGARLVVIQRQAQRAYLALVDANLLPDNLGTGAIEGEDGYDGEDEDAAVGTSSYVHEEPSKLNSWRTAVVATAAASLIIAVLFFIPWRLEHTNEIVWAPVYRPPLSHATTFQELGTARVNYESGEVAVEYLLVQVFGIVAVGWLASVIIGALAQSANGEEEEQIE